MPSATGQNWEKYQKKFDDEEEEEKKIVPLSEEYVCSLVLGGRLDMMRRWRDWANDLVADRRIGQ